MFEKAVIFDMDGLLIDSEPLWQEAGMETLSGFGVNLTAAQYHSSTGLRTSEWIQHWFNYFRIDASHSQTAISTIETKAIEKIKHQGLPLPGVEHVFNFFIQKQYKIGLASSSPMKLIDVVVDKLRLRPYLNAISSAGTLPYGKPHPQVFLDCASALETAPFNCIVFEDSFNGMIAAKAARMKCVVVPPAETYNDQRWGAADQKLRSLANFNELLLQALWA